MRPAEKPRRLGKLRVCPARVLRVIGLSCCSVSCSFPPLGILENSHSISFDAPVLSRSGHGRIVRANQSFFHLHLKPKPSICSNLKVALWCFPKGGTASDLKAFGLLLWSLGFTFWLTRSWLQSMLGKASTFTPFKLSQLASRGSQHLQQLRHSLNAGGQAAAGSSGQATGNAGPGGAKWSAGSRSWSYQVRLHFPAADRISISQRVVG
jgi:hypothetical protein